MDFLIIVNKYLQCEIGMLSDLTDLTASAMLFVWSKTIILISSDHFTATAGIPHITLCPHLFRDHQIFFQENHLATISIKRDRKGFLTQKN